MKLTMAEENRFLKKFNALLLETLSDAQNSETELDQVETVDEVTGGLDLDQFIEPTIDEKPEKKPRQPNKGYVRSMLPEPVLPAGIRYEHTVKNGVLYLQFHGKEYLLPNEVFEFGMTADERAKIKFALSKEFLIRRDTNPALSISRMIWDFYNPDELCTRRRVKYRDSNPCNLLQDNLFIGDRY